MGNSDRIRRRDVVAGIIALAGAAGAGNRARAAAASKFAAVMSRWDRDDHPDLKAVVVRIAGRLVVEHYFNGESRDELHDMRSAGKSTKAWLGLPAKHANMRATYRRSVGLLSGWSI